MRIEGGRLTGTGQTVVYQGTVFELGDSRLRFRLRFTDLKQAVAVAINAGEIGSGGVRISLTADGKLVLSDGATIVGAVQTSPLDDGEERFVEVVLGEQASSIRIARKNYPTKQSQLDGELKIGAWEPSAKSAFATVALTATGIAPTVDDIHFARCGSEPPAYETLLFDDFERPNSTSIGQSEVPPGLVWEGTEGTSISDGSLLTRGVSEARIPLGVLSQPHVRVRARIRGRDGETAFWTNFNYNSAAVSENVVDDPGFWVWGYINKASYLTVFGTGNETNFDSARVSLGTDYFVEFTRSQSIALLSMRSTSFDGPIMAALLADVSGVPNTGDYFKLGSSGSAAVFEDIRVESYPP